jgi:hypothetical protein
MLKLGIFVDDMNVSERNYCLIEQLNQISYRNGCDTRIFYRNLTPPCIELNCASMPSSEVYAFNNGVLITTNIETTIIAARSPISSKIIFYVDDIEWIRNGKYDYFHNLQAYGSKYVTLISKSQQYADCLYNYCNRRTRVVPKYYLEGILQHGYFQNNTNVYRPA